MANRIHSAITRLEAIARRSVLLNRIHFIVQKFWVGLLYASGALWWAKRQLRLNGSIVVLMFHRVLKDPEFKLPYNLPGVVVRENTFRELAAHVKKHYEAIQLEGAIPGQNCKTLRIAFTFDDGWTDNYAVALPIAREFEIPLTIFVCPGLVGSPQPFWTERMTNHFASSGGSVQKADIAEMIDTVDGNYTSFRHIHWENRWNIEFHNVFSLIRIVSDIDIHVRWPWVLSKMGRTLHSYISGSVHLVIPPVFHRHNYSP